MNRKGQSLVLFVVLLPIIIMLFAILFDTVLVGIEKRKLDNIAAKAINYMYKNYSDRKIYNYISSSDSDVVMKSINREKLEVDLYKKVDSYFGGIVGIEKYDVESNFKGIVRDNKLLIEKR